MPFQLCLEWLPRSGWRGGSSSGRAGIFPSERRDIFSACCPGFPAAVLASALQVVAQASRHWRGGPRFTAHLCCEFQHNTFGTATQRLKMALKTEWQENLAYTSALHPGFHRTKAEGVRYGGPWSHCCIFLDRARTADWYHKCFYLVSTWH